MTLRLAVWAPAAVSVEVNLPSGRVPLEEQADGWFALETTAAGPGDDYAFVLDGGPPLPDPRSPWQPAGVHGPSRLVDHGAFQWTDDGWEGIALEAAVVYEMHVGTFTPEGTFDAAVGRLPHLVDLGVNVLEIMPVGAFTGVRGWGYDGVGLYAPHQAYGGPDGLKRLVDACHAVGIAVVIDVVYNHLGPSGNYLGLYGPYFTDRYATPWGDAVNFDGPDSGHVRAFFIENALMWLRDYHCDGLRLDAVHAIFDSSAVHFLEQLAAGVSNLGEQLGRRVFVIAESDLNDPRVVRPRSEHGYGIDAQWNDDFHHALHAAITGERTGYYQDFGSVEDIATALQEVFVYAGRYSRHRRKVHGRPPVDLSGSRFVGYSQTHDQVGNRAQGERLGMIAGPELAQVAAALVLTSPFVPMLFQGEEWAASTPFQYFTDHEDPELGSAVAEGRRREFAAFGWKPDDVPDPQAPATFERSKLRWEELGLPQHAAVLEWYRALIRLRKTSPDLCGGARDRVVTRFDEAERWLVVERGAVTLACNLSSGPVAVPLDPARRARVLLATGSERRIADGVELPPTSATIYSAHAAGPLP